MLDYMVGFIVGCWRRSRENEYDVYVVYRLDGIISLDQMSMSSVEELVMLSIWKRVDPKITKRKMPSSQGPTWEDSYFF